MAARVPRALRGSVFSTNTALGFFGMAAGALAAGLPALWRQSLPGAAGYRPLFVFMAVISLACTFVIATATDSKPAIDRPSGTSDVLRNEETAQSAAKPGDERFIRREENKNMAKLAGVNVLNGLAVGFMGPMMSYWFALRFGVSSSQIGTTLALSFVFTGLSSLVTGWLTRRFGMVKSVVWLRLFGIILVFLLPWSPTFWLASMIYVIRSAVSRGTQGARSALGSSLTRDRRRGFSVSMNALAMRLPSAVGPTLSGAMIDTGIFVLPFFIAGGLQLCSNLLYGFLFRGFDDRPSRTRTDRPGTNEPK